MNTKDLQEKNLMRAAKLVAYLKGRVKKLQAQIQETHKELKEVNGELAEAEEYLDDLTKAKSD